MVTPGNNWSPAFSSIWVTALLWSQPVEKLSPFLPWDLHHFTASGSWDCLDGLNSSTLVTLEKSKPEAQTNPHEKRRRGPPWMSKVRVQWVSWCQFCMSWSLPRSFVVRGWRERVGWRSYFGSRVSSWGCCWCTGERQGLCSWCQARSHPCLVQQH